MDMLKRILSFVLISIIICFSTSCTNQDQKSEIEKVESFAKNNDSDIQIVCDYLLNTQYHYASIESVSGKMYVMFEYIDIKDPTVNDSIKTLWKENCKQITLDTSCNAISFLLGRSAFDERDYGLVYPINNTSEINVEFQTELVPLDNNKYYYYVSDYNKWRLSR